MKKIIISLIFLVSVIAAFGQQGVSGIFYRVQDSTTYQAASGTTIKHSQGYRDIYFNEQATTPHWDIWNGSSYTHVFDFNSGGGGTIDGSGTTNELPYWVDSNTLGSLAVATYPSLTELSKVKGVTGSDIQTQLNTKLTGPTNTFGFLQNNGSGTLSYAGNSDRTLTSSGDTDQSDNGNIIYYNSGSAGNLQVDLLIAKTKIDVVNLGAGTLTLTEGSGVDLTPNTIAVTTGQTATIIYRIAGAPEVYTQASSGGSGSVTSVSVVSANGFAGTVATSTTTPSITLTTSITGVLKGNGTAMSAATNADLPAMSATVGGAVPTPPNNTTTFLRGDGTFAAPAGGGDALTSNPLSQFAATTSAQLRTVLSDESGGGNAYFQGGDAGTPSAIVLTSGTGLPYTGLTGTVPFYSLASGGTATGVNTFTSNTAEQILHTGAWTATANNQAHERFSASPTSRNTASDILYTYLFDGTMTRNGGNPATQRAVYVGIRPTFANAFAKTESLNILGNLGLGTPLTNTAASIVFHTSSSENILTSAGDAIGVSTSAGGTPLVQLKSSTIDIVTTGGLRMANSTAFVATTGSKVAFRLDEDVSNIQALMRFFGAPASGTTTANQYFSLGIATTNATTGAANASILQTRDNTAGNGTASLAILSENSIPNIIGSQAGFGTFTPNSNLSVIGSFSAGYVAKTATYTADITDYTIECTANTFTVTLPTAVGITGRIYNVVNSGAGVITIATTSSQTFVNVATNPTTLTLTGIGVATVQSNGANWIKISGL